MTRGDKSTEHGRDLATAKSSENGQRIADRIFVQREGAIHRIGLATNAGSVSITTTDSSLVAVSPDEQPKMLATTRVTA